MGRAYLQEIKKLGDIEKKKEEYFKKANQKDNALLDEL